MKHKVADLDGALLDAAVAKACGIGFEIVGWPDPQCLAGEPVCRKAFEPSTDWAQGGPIIERERIALDPPDRSEWRATKAKADEWAVEYGPTPLIAAMRAFVASKFGDEVDRP